MNFHKKALRHLSKNDKAMAGIIRQLKLKPLAPAKNHFQSLVVSIINQQLSGKAADTITRRFVGLFGKGFPRPEAILKLSYAKLRTAGLSFSKISYIKNITQALKNREIDFKKLKIATDEEIIQALTKLKGIGRWTAEMFLIFSLARPDVFSKGDLGLRNAVKKLYKIDAIKNKKKIDALKNLWKPHRSLASRHLWASLEL